MGASLSLNTSSDDENGRRRVQYLDSTCQTAPETSSTGYRKLIYVSNGGVLLAVKLHGVERRSTSRPKSSVIAGSTALADARIGIGRRFWSGIHPSYLHGAPPANIGHRQMAQFTVLRRVGFRALRLLVP
ncbi:hypothetical protein THAOC_10577 [Thalassiosira oceanica]|uniref:Uncharacterized protein n=1 Tax=Thalassiosira oceanica TaxID=159749 RepID=K0SSA2_THAOC|nr:hypothetical protein THAOC_10577 [Thalassiosira oceanica]|eukprot:EJK68260.1 hypothetical protein THAOC_10577 [Thalassiosira oceanica]